MTKGRIAFQGEMGANSHEACMAAFPDMDPVPYATFEEAFDAVKGGECELGMIPVENSIMGRVADVHHLLPSSGLKIIGEYFKPIHFQLMANRGVTLADLKTVASMSIALGQCRKSIRKLGLKTEAVGDTALDGASQAIASGGGGAGRQVVAFVGTADEKEKLECDGPWAATTARRSSSNRAITFSHDCAISSCRAAARSLARRGALTARRTAAATSWSGS